MKSMTGYGEATAQRRWAKVVIQVRTLNHRHLDIQSRIPREYLAIEEEIRRVIRQRMARGRVEIFINRTPLKGQGRKLQLDEELLGQYVRGLNRAQRKFGFEGKLDFSLLAQLPELFQLGQADIKQEDEKSLVLGTLESALKKVERSREREGLQLKSDILLQLKHLRQICAGLGREAKTLARSRLEESPSLRGEENFREHQRDLSESLSRTLKGDINEEIVRLKSHVEELASLVQEREPIGKKLDFLLQEIQRELNTISAKVPHLPVVRLVLSGKEKVEKIREQAQNIE
ncbi:MAG: YicC family protein [Deltaproteobacteria bacterium]|nr:MAG: YicC family protein [Deltaproteobacteria bacterium]